MRLFPEQYGGIVVLVKKTTAMRSALRACRRTLVCILASALALSLSAQSFVHRYRNASADQYYDAIHPLRDGRIMAGGAASANSGRAAAALLDPEGNVLWNRVYGGQPGFAWVIADCAETAGGDLLALLNVSDADNTYTNLARLSAQNGAVLEARRFGDNNRYAVYYHITRTSDGFMLSGAVGATSKPTGFSLLKTDADGAVLWQRSVQHPKQKGALRGAVVSEDGHIWATAALEDNLGTIGRVGLFHFDAAGNLLAAYQYRAADPLRRLLSISIAWQPGTGPVLGCSYYLDGPTGVNPLIAQLDTAGEVLWSKILNTPPSTYNSAYLHSLPDGNLLAVCGSGGIPNLGVLAKLDPSGSVVWMRDLTTNDGPETVQATGLDEQGNLYGAGTAFAPLPLLERKGFVFKTDDPRYDKASCCSREVQGQTLDAPVLPEPFALTGGEVADPVPVSIVALDDPVQRQSVCSTAAAPQIEWSDTSACPGACVTLRLIPPGAQVYTLTTPGANPVSVQFSDSTTLCFPKEGTYLLRLDDGDCVRTEVPYTVRQRLPGPVTLSDTLICPGRCITPASPGASAPGDYFWVFEGGQPDTFAGLTPPEICYTNAGTYPVRLYIAGCGFSEQTLEVSSRPFRIPNAFTPDGDGNNDLFRPLLDCPAGQYLFEVYNRWGQKVFATADPVAGWDGNCDGKASPSDVYAWFIYFGEPDAAGQVLNRKEKGQVTLLR